MAAKRPLHVTDHALVRYLERVRGFKFERERDEIRRICRGVESNGHVKYDSCIFEIKNGAVVTVMPATGSPCRTRREEARVALSKIRVT